MGEAKYKIKEETKDVCKAMEALWKEFNKYIDAGCPEESIDVAEKCADMLFKFADIKKDTVESIYKQHILEAMEEADYGEDYDEGGRIHRKGYSRMRPEIYRRSEEPDWDDYSSRESGRMYTGARDAREGRTGQARKSYMETKQMHRSNSPEDVSARVSMLRNLMRVIGDDFAEMSGDMMPEEKNVIKAGLQDIGTKI